MIAARWAAVGALALITAGCSAAANDKTGVGAEAVAAEAATNATLTVAAASSLTDVLEVIAEEFTATTGVPVRTTYAGSSTLAEQVRAGGPIDVIAAAGTAVIDPLDQEDRVTDVTDFATNALMIAVPTGNPAGVRGLSDLAGVSVVVCAEQVPCGTSTQQLFTSNDVDVRPVSYERDVRAVLMKVRTGEADAGLVYVTDAAAAMGEVEGVKIPTASNVSSIYQAAVVTESAAPAASRQFVAFLNTAEAQEALAAAGFGPPP